MPEPVDGNGDPHVEPRKIKKRWYVLGGIVFVLVSAVISASLIRLPYFTLSPGSVRNTQKVIDIADAPSFDNDGEVDYATVSMKRATILGALAGWMDDSVEVIDEKKILGDNTESENREINLRDMTDSKQVATYVALSHLGYDVTTSGTGAVVTSVLAGSAADGHLAVGDTVVRAEGHEVTQAVELVDVIATLAPGDVLHLVVQRPEGGDEREESVTLGAREDDPTKALLGVSSATRDLQFHFPVQVNIDSGSVGGPSAGLAFTLGIIDRMVPGSITGGLKVATTGTINIQGDVGPVGGVPQKTVAVKRSGAQLFLVPSSEYEEARRFAGDMRVEPVDTLDDALEVLATVGGGTRVLPSD